MQAVIVAGGKQYLVVPDQTLEIDLAGDATSLEFVPLLVIDGDKVTVGTPSVAGFVVKAKVLEETKGQKIKVLKFKAKKRVKRLTGHRQHFSKIQITGIGTAKVPTKTAPTKVTAKPAAT